MELTVASYNIRKAVGLDRRRDPERIVAILAEIGADIVALQEADRRFGSRAAVLPRDLLARHGWQVVPLATRPASIGWHGNALLYRAPMELVDAERLDLPTLEPRGAVRADLLAAGHRIRIAGMHLDLIGLRRRQQLRTVIAHCAACEDCPGVLLGDFNEWLPNKGALKAFAEHPWRVLKPGRSFPSRRPLGALDRIVVSEQWELRETGVHHSALAARGSDHLPVYARLVLP